MCNKISSNDISRINQALTQVTRLQSPYVLWEIGPDAGGRIEKTQFQSSLDAISALKNEEKDLYYPNHLEKFSCWKERDVTVIASYLKHRKGFKKFIYVICQLFRKIFCKPTDKQRFHEIMTMIAFDKLYNNEVDKGVNPDNYEKKFEFGRKVHTELLRMDLDYVAFLKDALTHVLAGKDLSELKERANQFNNLDYERDAPQVIKDIVSSS
ncbi:MAG: hypothetical protein MRY21_07575 [Simkaniaceae bacterium]|nr:hypothetical protein [Simkaniaceae bacterium]